MQGFQACIPDQTATELAITSNRRSRREGYWGVHASIVEASLEASDISDYMPSRPATPPDPSPQADSSKRTLNGDQEVPYGTPLSFGLEEDTNPDC